MASSSTRYVLNPCLNLRLVEQNVQTANIRTALRRDDWPDASEDGRNDSDYPGQELAQTRLHERLIHKGTMGAFLTS